MSRKYLHAAKCSQMSSPKTGTGTGGDMCTEAVGSMIECTYKLGPKAKAGVAPEEIMHDLTAWIPNNGGNPNRSHLENFGVWFPTWLKTYGYDHILHLAPYATLDFDHIIQIVDKQLLGVAGFNDYVNLRLADGSNPYKWNDPHGLGHVLLIVGYDTDKHTVVVHDPLRADPSGQPADYSWSGFEAAKFASLTEVVGPKLPYAVDTETQPAPAPDPQAELAAWRAYGAAVEAALVTLGKLPKPPS